MLEKKNKSFENFENLTSIEFELKFEILIAISQFYFGLLLVVGGVGNFLCLVMLFHRTLKRRSPVQYLIALAFVDLGFLITVKFPKNKKNRFFYFYFFLFFEKNQTRLLFLFFLKSLIFLTRKPGLRARLGVS